MLLRWRAVASLLRGREISPAFRERLMLVVTAVNACPYCARLHHGAARWAGVPDDEATALLAGVTATGPTGEVPALRYARHWAERDAVATPRVRAEIETIYGRRPAEQIDVALRLIRIGNLAGNTFDALRTRIRRWLAGQEAPLPNR